MEGFGDCMPMINQQRLESNNGDDRKDGILLDLTSCVVCSLISYSYQQSEMCFECCLMAKYF